MFLSYSSTSKAYRIFNQRTLVVEESIHISFDDNMPLDRIDDMCANLDKVKLDEKNENNELKEDRSNIDAYNQLSNIDLPKKWKYVKDHPKDLTIGEPSNRVQTRSSLRNLSNLVFLSKTKPKNIDEALGDEFWI